MNTAIFLLVLGQNLILLHLLLTARMSSRLSARLQRNNARRISTNSMNSVGRNQPHAIQTEPFPFLPPWDSQPTKTSAFLIESGHGIRSFTAVPESETELVTDHEERVEQMETDIASLQHDLGQLSAVLTQSKIIIHIPTAWDC